nr:MAG TPA: hypothetical protein [Caudoviricetes sp.]
MRSESRHRAVCWPGRLGQVFRVFGWPGWGAAVSYSRAS